MAVIDPKDDCIVVRVVYDGAPYAGKTTSVAALGRGLGAGVYSPADLNGRTLYFDWLDYTGGLFEGRRIRCQIVSVPGQASLARRRRRLLESADVIVFVGDSSPTGFKADRRSLHALRGFLSGIEGPPIGIVLQANKRDLPDAVSLKQLRDMLDELQLRSAIIESVATEGTGIRETFVFAVRLALDRVQELMRSDALVTAQPKINSADDLLQDLKRADNGDAHTDTLAATAFHEVLQTNFDGPSTKSVAQKPRAGTPSGAPAVPTETVASGLVWPPVDGRLILHETNASPPGLRRDGQGSWLGSIDNRWWLHSAADAVFDNVDSGRAELVQWARQHAAGGELLSKHRCLVLADDGHGRHRLWQIVRIEPSLRTQLEEALLADATVIADTLLTASRAFMTMAERISAAMCELQLTLATVGVSMAGSAYLGFLPPPSQMRPARAWSSSEAIEHLLSELAFAQPTLRARRSDLLTELSKLARANEGPASSDWRLMQRLAALARQ